MSVLGPILLAQTVSALAGIDPTPSDVAVAPSTTRFIEARTLETVVRGRPWVPYPRMATVAKGTRFVVRGQVESRDPQGCHGQPWYAIWPFGYVCSEHVRPSDTAPLTTLALPVAEGKRLPHQYVSVREDGAPIYANAQMAELGQPEHPLTRGMSLVIERGVDIGERRFVQTSTGRLVPREAVGYMGQGSEWQGVELVADRPGPLMAWVRADRTAVRATPDKSAASVRTLALRERVPLLEPSSASTRPLWWRIGPQEWVEADALNEVHIVEPPAGTVSAGRVRSTANDQWFDVDVGEQVVVAYRGPSPQYATLISSGRGSPTPLGNYPLWAKVASMDMANQDYEDKPYMVQGVPWVLLFQGHNALHGAYWHDRFGHRKSHGCVNLAPVDARWLFEWVGPTLPEGWTGYLPPNLDRSPVVHVRDSSRAPGDTFTQQRPVGPPDREAEQAKIEAAERKRAELAEALSLEGLEDPSDPDPETTRIEAPPMPRSG